MPDSNEKVTRQQLIDGLNEDLSREYQAIITYVNYSQVLKGAAYMAIAKELEVHAKEELDHALQVFRRDEHLRRRAGMAAELVQELAARDGLVRDDEQAALARPA